jgi:hypothetical protein
VTPIQIIPEGRSWVVYSPGRRTEFMNPLDAVRHAVKCGASGGFTKSIRDGQIVFTDTGTLEPETETRREHSHAGLFRHD